jgi:hypothetical protein
MVGDSREWNAERMFELANHHAKVEVQKRLEPLMETLVAEPLYEFHVQGLTLRGGAPVRRYYQQFFDDYLARAIGGERLGAWGDENAVAREDLVEIRGDDGPETHRIMSVLYLAEDRSEGYRLGGERIYASDAVVRSMAGVMFDELLPIAT